MQLLCAVQQYHWGKLGSASLVARLGRANDPRLAVREESPYAELWMGTHPSGPAVVRATGEALGGWLRRNPCSLGARVLEQFGQDLPFLFKVLSVRQALSVQAHPAKGHAEELHRLRPDLYKDPNHKPELAVALTPFQAMCDFRPAKEIRSFLQNIAELREVVGEDAASRFVTCDEAGQQEALKACFSALMMASSDCVASQLTCLIKRVSTLGEADRNFVLAPLLEELESQFPGDVGCFVIYFLNVMTLQPGEALFLAPNEPHAYLSGDCVECMACSDNVVRAGLTPKHKDIKTLCEMLTYNCQPAADKLFVPSREDDCTQVFLPPVSDFAVAHINVTLPKKRYALRQRSTASILLVVEGSASTSDPELLLSPGSVVFLPACAELSVHPTGDVALDIYQAFANV
ncbi:mannose-6-phosphate isomerase [Bacillus rossius redtenbacheri]|uniref:mannose-6-phosphate isomerase n=1 Tax=Bacillus rossius redtenbacheri TaxID=93214 RepID=UPI002FDD3DAA